MYPQQYYPPGPPVYVHQQPGVVIQQQQPGVVIQQQAPPVVVNETVVVGGRRPTVVVEEKVVVRERPRVRSFSWKNIFTSLIFIPLPPSSRKCNNLSIIASRSLKTYVSYFSTTSFNTENVSYFILFGFNPYD